MEKLGSLCGRLGQADQAAAGDRCGTVETAAEIDCHTAGCAWEKRMLCYDRRHHTAGALLLAR